MKIECNKDSGDSEFICEFWERLHRGVGYRRWSQWTWEKQMFQEVRVYAKVWRYRSPWHVIGTWLGKPEIPDGTRQSKFFLLSQKTY